VQEVFLARNARLSRLGRAPDELFSWFLQFVQGRISWQAGIAEVRNGFGGL
jgi:hypothetical protein